MTREGTESVFKILETAYPQFYKGKDIEDKKNALRLWFEMLKPYSDTEVAISLKAFIASDDKGFPPVIGQIISKLETLKKPEEMSEIEAWAKVKKALKNGYYGYQEEWAKLPEDVRRVLGRPETLREWATVDISEVETVIGSNFMRSFRAKQSAAKEYARLPEGMRNDLKMLTEGIGHDF